MPTRPARMAVSPSSPCRRRRSRRRPGAGPAPPAPPRLDGAVVHLRRLDLDAAGAGGCSPASQAGRRETRLRNSSSRKRSRTFSRSRGFSRRPPGPGHRHVGGDGRHALAVAGLLLVRAQDLAQLLRLHLVEVLVDVLDAAELLDQLRRRLLADAGHAGDVVRGVALEPLEVGHLLRLDAVALAGPLLVVDHGVALVGAEHEEVDAGLHQLGDVAVQGDDVGLEALLRRLAGQGAQDVVGLVALHAKMGMLKASMSSRQRSICGGGLGPPAGGPCRSRPSRGER